MKKISIILIASILFATTGFAQKQKYKIPQCEIDYAMEFMGMSFEAVSYFKNYGEKQSVITKMEMMGQKTTTQVLTTATHVYQLNLEKKTGTKTALDKQSPDDLKSIDYDNISKEVKEKYNIKELGKETIAGKTCKIFSIEKDGAESKFWIWNNIPVKYEVSQSGMKIVMTAKKIDTNPTFPAGIFDVPKDYSITDLD